MKVMLKKFWKEEAGLETVEYAVLLALIVILIVAAIAGLRGAIVDRLDQAATVVGSTE